MPRPAVIGVDIGTSSSKGVLVDGDGELLASAVVEHAVQRPGPGMFEMDGGVWWDEFVALSRRLLAEPDVDVQAVGVSGMGPVQATVTPRREVAARYEELYRLYRALYPQTADTVHALASRRER
jgi:sugar (pentulose or hexulose) kinase